MGAASTEIELHARGRAMHLGVTSARLDLVHGRPGTVLVVEDATELPAARSGRSRGRKSPSALPTRSRIPSPPSRSSAERIGKHLDRGQPDSPGVIRKCAEVILTCVGTLRTLVDQFSALAQFPASQPRACDINQVVEEALALFAGRLDEMTVKRDLEPGLPPVMADPDAIRRALANLIDNAAEAMHGSLLRVLGVRSALSEDGTSAEVSVSDTGHGLTDEIRERLFLPYYSTKHRGTGLGLSIAAKIAQEHGGTIRAESNSPKGARFILRVPLIEPVPQPPQNVASTTPATWTCRSTPRTKNLLGDPGRRGPRPHAESAEPAKEVRFMNHVLVVDDEAEIRSSLEEILREEGYGAGHRRLCRRGYGPHRGRSLRRRASGYLAAGPRWHGRALRRAPGDPGAAP